MTLETDGVSQANPKPRAKGKGKPKAKGRGKAKSKAKPKAKNRSKSKTGKAKPRPIQPPPPKELPIKVTIRKLPYFLQKSDFDKAVSAWSSTFSYLYFVPGKSHSNNSGKKPEEGRAYIGFDSKESLEKFKFGFSGHKFLDRKGVEYTVLVEYAPYQILPVRPTVSNTTKSLETDPNYLKFVEALDAPVEYLPSAEVQLEQRDEADKQLPVTTPLLEHIKAKRASKKKRSKAKRLANNKERRKRKEKLLKGKAKPKAHPKDKAEDGETAQGTAKSRAAKLRAERRRKKREEQRAEGGNSRKPRGRGGPVGQGGMWMAVKKQMSLEPGSITIQKRPSGADTGTANQPSDHPSNLKQNKSYRGRGRRRRGGGGRGGEQGGAPKRIYTRKGEQSAS